MKVSTFFLVLAVILVAVVAAVAVSPDLARPAGILALAAAGVLAVVDVKKTKAAKAEKPRARAGKR